MCIETVQLMQKHIVHKQIHVSPYRTRFVTDAAIELRVTLFELFERRTHGRSRHSQFRRAAALGS